jgi:hypothetical protein
MTARLQYRYGGPRERWWVKPLMPEETIDSLIEEPRMSTGGSYSSVGVGSRTYWVCMAPRGPLCRFRKTWARVLALSCSHHNAPLIWAPSPLFPLQRMWLVLARNHLECSRSKTARTVTSEACQMRSREFLSSLPARCCGCPPCPAQRVRGQCRAAGRARPVLSAHWHEI